ncbi:hypothetical protein ACFRMQ_26070 [Kitasatospora sp. NPDC056783]|uniref:hypothetical protein n=1 Tax=Kitasatospora sp. NPDC056783 TaxID=3345943 RepID=UPI0036A46472
MPRPSQRFPGRTRTRRTSRTHRCDRSPVAAALSAAVLDAGLDLHPLLRLAVAVSAVVLTLGGRLVVTGPLSLFAGRYRAAGSGGLSLSVSRGQGPARHLAVGVRLGERGFGMAAALGPLSPMTTLATLLGTAAR